MILIGTKSDEFSRISSNFHNGYASHKTSFKNRKRLSVRKELLDLNQMNHSFPIEPDFEHDKTQETLENIENTYEILRHIKCSSLTGENIKLIFDEAM